MKAYKMVPRAYARDFRLGRSIAIGTLSYYRCREDGGERSDPYEGITVRTTGSSTVVVTNDTIKGVRGGVPIVTVGEGSFLTLKNVSFSHGHPEFYIFCMSAKPDDLAREKGLVAFEITDVSAFGALLARDNNNIIGNGFYDKVVYGPKVFPVLGEELPEFDPFYKNESLKFEDEVRIVWEPSSAHIEPWVLLKSKVCSHLIKRVI